MRKASFILLLTTLTMLACDDSTEVGADSETARVRDSGRGLGNVDMFVISPPDLGVLGMDSGTAEDGGDVMEDSTPPRDAALADGELTDTAPLMDPDAAPPADDDVFPSGLAGVLARYELNGNVDDASGNERVMQRLGGVFMRTAFGQGLMVNDASHGLDWSEHATLLSHPFSIEMVFTPMEVPGQSYAKIFDTNGMTEAGWYLQSEGFRNWPVENEPLIGRRSITNGQRAYLAFVSTEDNAMHVYINGEKQTEQPIGARFENTPPGQALFFKDDGNVSENEHPHALIEALRISSVNRSAEEIAEVQNRLSGAE